MGFEEHGRTLEVMLEMIPKEPIVKSFSAVQHEYLGANDNMDTELNEAILVLSDIGACGCWLLACSVWKQQDRVDERC